MNVNGVYRRGLKHYTAVILTVALMFGQIVPVSAAVEADRNVVLSSLSEETGMDTMLQDTDTVAEEGLILEDEGPADELTDETDMGGLTEELISEEPLAEELISLSEDSLSDDEVLLAGELTEEELIDEGSDAEAGGVPDNEASNGMYTLNAKLLSGNTYGRKYPGVYTVKALSADKVTDNNMTIGIPSLNDKLTLATKPTSESPAIIMGAAVPYEEKTGPVDYKKLSDNSVLYAPYSKFRYQIIEEANLNGSGTHKKMSGFDGTYLIIRVDVSDIVSGNNGRYLHVKQSNNKALMVQSGMTVSEGSSLFSDAMGTQTGSFYISDNKLKTRDADGDFTECSFIDVIFMSSGTLVQGADTGTQATNAKSPTADFPLSFYIDDTNDYNPGIEWNSSLLTAVNRSDGKPITIPQAEVDKGITAADYMLNKYYDESKASGSKVSKYTIKGSDVELEMMVEGEGNPKPKPIDGANEYWSLKKAMESGKFDGKNIKLICEAPLLNSINVDGVSRNVILDVNSFDIQLANHKDTNAAALKVTGGAKLEITDSFETTGAELAVGNNATMEISGEGSTLIISKKAQLEVEYDAASVSSGSADKPTYNSGVITVRDGGTIENYGVISVEGKEGKPQNPADAAGTVRDFKNAVLTIGEGGTLSNNGCVLMNGYLYNYGTIKNSGKYEDKITSYDPDKGSFTYHKGIQLSWKDDITQGQTDPGAFYNGIDDTDKVYGNAVLENTGDIVMVPGFFYNAAKVNNKAEGKIYMCAVDEIVIPIAPFADKPTMTEQRIDLGYGEPTWFTNDKVGIINNWGLITAGQVDIVNNGRTGDKLVSGNDVKYRNKMYITNDGTFNNYGTVSVDSLYTMGRATNNANGLIERVIVDAYNKDIGRFDDNSTNKGTKVYNASLTTVSTSNVWDYAPLDSLVVLEDTKKLNGKPGDTVEWKIKAKKETGNTNGTKYLVWVNGENTEEDLGVHEVIVNVEKTISNKNSYADKGLPDMNCNAVYSFSSQDKRDYAVVKVNGNGLIKPTAMQGPGENNALVYNGKQQQLVTPGSIRGGKVQYRLGESGEFTDTIPTAKDAGTYKVTYRTVMNDVTIPNSEGIISITINRRNAYIAADDEVSKQGENINDLTYVSYGFLKEDAIVVTTNTTVTTASDAGRYVDAIQINHNANVNNYDVQVYPGTYTILASMNEIKDISAQSVLTAYDTATNLSHSVSVNITYNSNVDESKKAVVYYSLSSDALTPANYKEKGTTIALKYGGISDNEVNMHYYIDIPGTDNDVYGTKQIVVVKGEQAVPKDIETMGGLVGYGGYVIGLVPFDANHNSMEIRRADQTEYKRAIFSVDYLPAGDYLVRYAGNERLNPSADFPFAIREDRTVTAKFYTYGGSEVKPVSGLIYGDVIEVKPTKPGYEFEGWFKDSGYTEAFQHVDSIVEGTDITLHAKWKFKNADAGVDEKDQDDFGKDTESAIVIPDKNKGTVTVSDANISTVTTDKDGKVTVDSKLWVGGLSKEYVYTGSAIKPVIHVYDGVRKLTEKVDYTVSYKNNKNAGKIGDRNKSGKSIAPTIVVRFKGNYQGNDAQSIEFNIVPASLKEKISVYDMSVAALSKNREQKPVPLIVWNDTGKQINKKFFTISYNNAVTTSGNYVVYVSAKDANYKDSVSANITVVNDKNLMLDKASVSIAPYIYTGEAITPEPRAVTKFKIGNKSLVFGTDYKIKSVYNNVEPGRATVIFEAVNGNKNNYVGTKLVYFNIKNGRILTDTRNGDFSYYYSSPVSYVKSGARPEVTVKDRDVTMVQGKDYTVSYRNNKAIASENAVNNRGKDIAPQIIIKGKGKYKGTVVLKFEITKKDISTLKISADDLFITKAEYIKGNYKKTKITISGTDGKKLGSKDFAIDGAPSIAGTGETGVTVTVNVKGTGNYYSGTNKVSFRLMDKNANIAKANAIRQINVQEYTGREITLSRNDLQKLLYTGKKDAPSYLHYKESGKADDFEVIGYTNNIKKGTAKVTVKGVGKFAGTKTLTFKIRSKNAIYQGALIDGIFKKFTQ